MKEHWEVIIRRLDLTAPIRMAREKKARLLTIIRISSLSLPFPVMSLCPNLINCYFYGLTHFR